MTIAALDVLKPAGGGAVTVTGGVETTPGDGYKYHTFNSNGTLVVSGGSKAIEYLIVGAGGSSSYQYPPWSSHPVGAGGGGGAVSSGSATLSAGSYSAVVGLGGGIVDDNGTAGGASSFNAVTSNGGQPGTDNRAGGPGHVRAGGASGNGNAGGASGLWGVPGGGGGAGGAGTAGVADDPDIPGLGGAGVSVWGTTYGRGNAGAMNVPNGNTFAVTANRGEGGASTYGVSGVGFMGGSSGVVVIRYPI